MKILALLLAICCHAPLLQAYEWQKTFYTDDSEYFLKLTHQGMIQRVRLGQNYCQEILSIKPIFKYGEQQAYVQFQKNLSHKSSWKKLYGFEESKYCWMEVKVSGLDLNSPERNLYVLEIQTRSSGTWYFEGYKESLLPQNRLTQKPLNQIEWISLGAFGPSHVEGGGVFFKFWDPLAQEVHLFLNDQDIYYVLKADLEFGNNKRSHSIYLNSAKAQDRFHYQLIKDGVYEILEVANLGHVSAIKIDPMAREISYDAKGGYHNGFINPRSVIHPKDEYWWQGDNIINNKTAEQTFGNIIYQVWPLTFNPQMKDQKFLGGTFKDIIKKTDYLHQLGINTIELLPVHESRFHASWGYALDSVVLIEKNLGTRDDLKNLIDTFHQRKIKIFFDIVLNHINNSLLREPLSPIVHKSKYFNGHTDWGPRPDFDNIMVQKWLLDSVLYITREFHLDGLRFDMTKYIYKGNQKGYQFLQELNLLLKANHPTLYTSAEELPDLFKATWPVNEGGLGFDTQWNDYFKNFFEHTFDHYRSNNRNHENLHHLQMAMQGFGKDEYGNIGHFGPPSRTVNYLGSHDFLGNKNPILRIVSDFDKDPSMQETAGDKYFLRVRPLENPINTENNFRLIHNSFTHSAARLAYGILFTKPGDILFFQGEEVGNDINIENEWNYLKPVDGAFPSANVDISRFVGSHRMPWEFLTPEIGPLSFLRSSEQLLFTGQLEYFKTFIQFRKNNPEFNAVNAQNVHIIDNLMTYEILTSNEHFFVLANFGADNQEQWVHFPGKEDFWWKEVINSSAKHFGGTNDKFLNIIAQKSNRPNHVRLPGTSLLLFKKVKKPELTQPFYFRSTINNWEANNESRLLPSLESLHIFECKFYSPSSGTIDFKLATKDWDIEMGESKNFEGKTVLSYRPSLPNIKATLDRGHYIFKFNMENFEYEFVQY